MKRIARLFESFAADERGATAIEYCMIAGLISIAIVGSSSQIGLSLNSMLGKVPGGLK